MLPQFPAVQYITLKTDVIDLVRRFHDDNADALENLAFVAFSDLVYSRQNFIVLVATVS